MPSWQGRSQANTLGYRIFVFLIQTFGIRSAYFLLYFVAGYYLLFSLPSSRAIFQFYRRRLMFGFLRSVRMVYGNYYVFGQTLIDKIAVLAGIPTGFTYDFDGEAHLKKMVEEKKGGLLLSAHTGSWEAAGHLLKRLNTRINIVMYDGEDRQIKKYLDEVTGERAYRVILVKDDLSHIYKINEALSANEIVCLHADRYLPGNKTLSARFFGEEALFPEGPFLLAMKLKVPVVYAFAFKEGPSHYHFYSTGLKYFYREDKATMQSILDDFVLQIEKMITRYPEQWFNYYDFWKK